MLRQVHILTVFWNNDIDPKFKIFDHVRVSKYKNIFAEDYRA